MGSRSLLLVEAAELFAGEDVEVDGVDGLAGEFADVGDDAVAVRNGRANRDYFGMCPPPGSPPRGRFPLSGGNVPKGQKG